MKRMIAMLLCICIVLSMAACGKPQLQSNPNQLAETSQLSRQDKELIAELVGGVDASDLSDEELDTLVEQLVGNKDTSSQVVNLNAGQKTEEPSVDVTQNPEVYDENGAMTKPFDQVYPELIEQGQVKFSGESILVKLASGKLTKGLKAAGIGALEEIVPLAKASWYEAKLVDGAEPKTALEAVRELDEVLLAEYNYEIQTALAPDSSVSDTGVNGNGNGNNKVKEQWHLKECGIQNASKLQKYGGGNSSTIVAVIDTGVDYDHEDLTDNIWVNTKEIPNNNIDDDKNGYVDDYYGVDIVSGKGNGDDTNGHGTHVAGIIAAQSNNLGVMGIAYNVKIMPVKAASHSGYFLQGDIAKAVLYAYENGAEVINMSFGGTACSIAVQDALAVAYTRSVLVAAAGNSGYPNERTDNYDPLPSYPAALTYVLGVMSVDKGGRESVFTNWDAKAFNGVEYELYAPGEEIVSTLPNDQYGSLSGTSMAAPMVSAMAAILRGEFDDRDMYPTKFIYGQLASTSDKQATCCNPQMHTVGGFPHNLPKVVNLHSALTKLPKPEVNVQEYYIFDDPKYSDKNNGDGVIDAGETIALGLVLRNRWGMSENTMVTIDTLSQVGMEDPYFTILNPTVDYGSVGTYSTQDCGKVYTDELFTGWENPFVIQVAEDCPNDYIFTLNITIRCENALDEKDKETYVTEGKMMEYVRAGCILPSIIEEDMTLTPENLYIIPNATVIKEGVTVRVEPGTHIQFWSDDADDPYADSYIAYLLVNGKFLVEGTKENPVYIYPSELMGHYGVEIGSSSKGYVSLKYADITNFFYTYNTGGNHTGTGNHIDLADHCTFRNNYSGHFYYRYLSNGVVTSTTGSGGAIGNINAKDCVFYKLAFSDSTDLYGTYDRCIFTQCGIDFKSSYPAAAYNTYKNCVFLDNAMVDQTRPNTYYNSSLELQTTDFPRNEEDLRVLYRPETGTTYVRWNTHSAWSAAKRAMDLLASYIEAVYGGGFFVAETMEEYQWLKDNGCSSYYVGNGFGENGYCWSDGTPLQADFLPKYVSSTNAGTEFLYIANNRLTLGTDEIAMYEIPGQILPTDITFTEYTVDMDMETTYQIAPLNTPVQLGVADFHYESGDESVLTVSDTGLVTPVGTGTADVWVWSLDKAVRNRITITVRDYVALEGIAFSEEAVTVAAGWTVANGITLTPLDTTRRNVVYTSSNEAVATVDAGGNITGVSSGTAIITATCEGFTDTIAVTVYNQATSLTLGSLALSASLSDGTLELPEVIASTGAEMTLSWRSTDESVAAIEEGKLALKALGTTSIVVTDSRSGLSASCLVIVTETEASGIRDMLVSDSYHYVLLENGDLYQWYTSYRTKPTLITSGVRLMDMSGSKLVVLLEDNSLWRYYNMSSDTYGREKVYQFADQQIVDIAYYNAGRYYIVTADGNVYAWGSSNTYGQLGLGSAEAVSEPTLVNLDGVVDVEAGQYATWFLTDKGELYVTGYLSGCEAYSTSLVPVCVDANVTQILAAYDYGCNYLSTDGKLKAFNGNGISADYYTYQWDFSDWDAVSWYGYNYAGIGVKDGKVYTFTSSTAPKEVPGICDAVDVYTCNGTHYIVTASDLLFGLGNNGTGTNHMAGNSLEDPVKTPVLIPIVPLAEESVTLTDSNLAEGILAGDTLTLTFNKTVASASPKLYANGTQVTVLHTVTDFNHVTLSRSAGFVEGVAYELVFEPGAIRCAGGVTNPEALRIAFTYAPNGQVTAPEQTPDQTPEQAPEEAPVVYESIFDATVERILTPKSLVEKLEAYKDKTQLNPKFTGNAILNPISTDFEVSHWLRLQAPTVSVGTYSEVLLGGNYWGSTNERAIGLQMIDYSDFPNYARLMYAPYLTEAPENTFPFVTSVKLFNKDGQEVTTVGNEEIRFQVKFNRDMDTSIPLTVRFGSAYPYGDYEISGQYVDARTWEGTYTLKTTIENGYQYFTISNGCSATDDLELQLDQYRFSFEIDTTAAQALIMQGTATDTGIELRWTQDDFDTLMGYNVYRSTKEDGLYTRVNHTTLPANVTTFFDTTVEPGVVYYYNFTVVKTDLTESEPSGKIIIMSKDTMAPNIYHSPAGSAFTGSNLVLTATITDNLNIAYANLYYRVAGQSEWMIIRMNKLNDKYSAIIPAQHLTTAGLEYYIEAFDGVSYTYNGTAETPYFQAVQEAVGADALGDVDGDGIITNLDALLLLYTINDKYNMTAEEFARADLNGDGELWAAEALRILQYVSGAVGSVKM